MVGDGYAGTCNQGDSVHHTDIARMLLAPYKKASVYGHYAIALEGVVVASYFCKRAPASGGWVLHCMLVPLCNVGINLDE